MKYTPDKVSEICHHLAEGKTRADACRLSGIGTSTFHEWLNEKAEFLAACRETR